MKAQKEPPKVIVVVGPTASGKTSLGIRLAKACDGEVVSADSRQVYRGLDLGSGKVTHDEMDGVPHHMIDVADPGDTYTASDFVRDGRAAISDILARGKTPIVVGGTFFYVDALLGKIALPDVPPNPELRAELEELETEELFAQLEAADPERASTIDRHNRVRLIRALEIVAALGSVPAPKSEPLYDAYSIAIDIPREDLWHNIHVRLHERLDEGMVAEVERLHAAGASWEWLEGLGLEYRHIARYLQGELPRGGKRGCPGVQGSVSYEAMREELEKDIRAFAKRQLTWLRRDDTLHWYSKDQFDQILQDAETFLDK